MHTVLIVDCNKNDIKILSHYINKFFVCKIFSAACTKDAHEIIERVKPDVIFTDIIQQDKNGYNFIMEVLNRHLDIPVFIVSAFNDKRKMEELLSSGVTACLSKPINTFKIYENLLSIFDSPKKEVWS